MATREGVVIVGSVARSVARVAITSFTLDSCRKKSESSAKRGACGSALRWDAGGG